MPGIRTRKNSLPDEKTIASIASKPSVPQNVLTKIYGSKAKDLNTTEENIPVSEDKEEASLRRISKEYNEYIEMFVEKKGLKALPKHQK